MYEVVLKIKLSAPDKFTRRQVKNALDKLLTTYPASKIKVQNVDYQQVKVCDKLLTKQ